MVVAGIGAAVIDFVTDPALLGSVDPLTGGDGVNTATNTTTARYTVSNDTVAGNTAATGGTTATFFIVFDGANPSTLQIYVETSPGSWDGSGTDGLVQVSILPVVIALTPDIVAMSDGTENDMTLAIATGPLPANPAGAPTLVERNAAPLVLLNNLGVQANFYCWPGMSQGAIDPVTGLPAASPGFTPAAAATAIDTVVVEAAVTTTTTEPPTTTTTQRRRRRRPQRRRRRRPQRRRRRRPQPPTTTTTAAAERRRRPQPPDDDDDRSRRRRRRPQRRHDDDDRSAGRRRRPQPPDDDDDRSADATTTAAPTTTTTAAPTTTTTAAPTTTTTTTPGAFPTNKDQCKDDGWQGFSFRNQGLCVSFVETSSAPGGGAPNAEPLSARLIDSVRPETPAQYALFALAVGFGLFAVSLALPLRRRRG